MKFLRRLVSELRRPPICEGRSIWKNPPEVLPLPLPLLPSEEDQVEGEAQLPPPVLPLPDDGGNTTEGLSEEAAEKSAAWLPDDDEPEPKAD